MPIQSAGDNFLGEIRMFAGNVAPQAWMPCDGEVLPVNKNSQLFSLLGTNYGGNGITTFGLPDLQARAPVSSGNPANLTPYDIGETGGVVTVTLTDKETPVHSHAPNATTTGKKSEPDNVLWATPGADRPAPDFYATSAGTAQNMNSGAIGLQGGGAAHNNLMPYTVMFFCIAIDGTYPHK
jgi:microcystin-dependent protein